jgi:uncharacterized caspase-like protein
MTNNRPFFSTEPDIVVPVAPPDRRIALVIGNGKYAAEWHVLANPPNDAQGVATALSRIGFFGVRADGDDFKVDFAAPGVAALIDLDQKQLRRALAALARVADGVRQAVIYYAGHGIEVAGQNYLIPVDAKLAHVRDAEYELEPLSRALGAITGATGLQLVILDACRNNPFRSRLFSNRDASAGLRGIEPPGTTLVAYAAKHGTFASDGKSGTNSPFAAALLAHIEKPGLEVFDLFREVKDDVLEATSGGQEPHLYGSPGRRREYFVSSSAVASAKSSGDTGASTSSGVTAYNQLQLAAQEWGQLEASGDIARLQSFAQHFPGYYGDLALSRASMLEKQAAERALQAKRAFEVERALEVKRAFEEQEAEEKAVKKTREAQRLAELERVATKRRATAEQLLKDRLAAWKKLRAARSLVELLKIPDQDYELLGVDFATHSLFATTFYTSTDAWNKIDTEMSGGIENSANGNIAFAEALDAAIKPFMDSDGPSQAALRRADILRRALEQVTSTGLSPIRVYFQQMRILSEGISNGTTDAAAERLELGQEARRIIAKNVEFFERRAERARKERLWKGGIAGVAFFAISAGMYWLLGDSLSSTIKAVGIVMLTLLVAFVAEMTLDDDIIGERREKVATALATAALFFSSKPHFLDIAKKFIEAEYQVYAALAFSTVFVSFIAWRIVLLSEFVALAVLVISVAALTALIFHFLQPVPFWAAIVFFTVVAGVVCRIY